MNEETLNAVQELVNSISSIYPNIQVDDEKQKRLYLALHDLKNSIYC